MLVLGTLTVGMLGVGLPASLVARAAATARTRSVQIAGSQVAESWVERYDNGMRLTITYCGR